MKLYMVTHEGLSVGQQSVQMAHALVEFQREHSDLFSRWYKESNTLVQLAVPTKRHLITVLNEARLLKIEASAFHEPAFDLQLTAIALAPKAESLLTSFALAFDGAVARAPLV